MEKMTKGEDESWFRTTHKDTDSTAHRDTMSVRVSNSAQSASKRPFFVGRRESLSDGEDNSGICWFPRGRSRSGESLSTVNVHQFEEEQGVSRSKSTAGSDRVFCCCGPRWGRKYTVEVCATDSSDDGSPGNESVLRTKGRWEIDVNEEYYKPPVWKQIIRKVKAQVRQVNSIPPGVWENYDSQSYEKNFDNGTWRDSSRNNYDADDSDEKLGLNERARHTALLQKFHSNRAQEVPGDVHWNSASLSPLPVRSLSKEKIDKAKEDFVPIWQRRAASPITLDLKQRTSLRSS